MREKFSMVDSRIIKEWLDKAEEDFNFATSVIETSPYYPQICFHYQQAAEKYLKSFIVAHELNFVKSHDLIILLDICLVKGPLLSEIKDECDFLNGFYIDTRYPVSWPANYTKQEAEKAKEAVEKIAVAIKALLKTEDDV